MNPVQEEWSEQRDRLVEAVTELGFPAELGEIVAKNLGGGPRALSRMTAYLRNMKPKSEELIIDEMLSIRDEITAWWEKKESEEALSVQNKVFRYGLDGYAGVRED